MKSIEKIIEEQIQRWQIINRETPQEIEGISVITISGEAGSGGRIVARRLADKLGLDIFHKEVLSEIARSAAVSEQLLQTLDERGLSTLEEWISSLVHRRHLWPDEYLQHLMKAVGTIARHGRAVIVGRGANFILPPGKRFAVRTVAPLARRVEQIAAQFGIPAEEARRRVTRTDNDRRAFVRKYFNADIDAPTNYDLVLNTATLGPQEAVKVISAALGLLECVFVG